MNNQKPISHYVRRIWHVGLTILRWKWRFHHLGRGSTVGRPLQCRFPRAISIGDKVAICSQSIMEDLAPGKGEYPKIVIGDGTVIMYRFQCNAALEVSLGRDVLIAANVLITDSDHVVDPDGMSVTRNQKLISRKVKIGNNCWIGQNAVILKGVTVGNHCIIGANAVVTKDVPDRSIVVGNPGRIIASTLKSNADT